MLIENVVVVVHPKDHRALWVMQCCPVGSSVLGAESEEVEKVISLGLLRSTFHIHGLSNTCGLVVEYVWVGTHTHEDGEVVTSALD